VSGFSRTVIDQRPVIRTVEGSSMATFERHVDVDWRGSVMEGKGEMKAGTGAFSLPVTFPSRVGESGGKTSPEELMAAAHAACYAMALNGTLGRKSASADRTKVTATITADRGESGIVIKASKLTVTAYGLKGLDAKQFAEVAKEAEGRCPVSNAYRGTMQITVEAKVA
jgi:lipoyl-dependent peroxiredoxin